MRLLLIEDEQSLREITARRLRDEGYSVDTCDNGEDGQTYIELTNYDAVILDIMLPRRDGLTVLRQIRAQKITTPVLLLTARDAIEDRVSGLDAGADDYLVKPFSFAELSARIRVLLRRQTVDQADSVLEIADLRMDLASRTVQRGDRDIQLTQREFTLLEVLLRYQGIVLTREKIAQHIYDYGFEGGSNVIDVYIRYLRRKVDQDGSTPLIHTVRGAGYVLREES
ncbi:MAG: response regulator transcription factor [Clostridia bacterium]|nr:response regulator transcription factor [Eubacteriales bacterium]MDD4461239.1 response regulator transcription factor [Eubacteriales bacterium]NCC49089.1 response regulator transcription factor [Clostridia bacterium]